MQIPSYTPIFSSSSTSHKLTFPSHPNTTQYSKMPSQQQTPPQDGAGQSLIENAMATIRSMPFEDQGLAMFELIEQEVWARECARHAAQVAQERETQRTAPNKVASTPPTPSSED
jgi:hypothetical protein